MAQTCPTIRLTVTSGQPPLSITLSMTAWAGGWGANVQMMTVVAKNAMTCTTMEMLVMIGRCCDRKMLTSPEMKTAARTHSVLCHDVEWYDGWLAVANDCMIVPTRKKPDALPAW